MQVKINVTHMLQTYTTNMHTCYMAFFSKIQRLKLGLTNIYNMKMDGKASIGQKCRKHGKP